jgi:hypothetical protein
MGFLAGGRGGATMWEHGNSTLGALAPKAAPGGSVALNPSRGLRRQGLVHLANVWLESSLSSHPHASQTGPIRRFCKASIARTVRARTDANQPGLV